MKWHMNTRNDVARWYLFLSQKPAESSSSVFFPRIIKHSINYVAEFAQNCVIRDLNDRLRENRYRENQSVTNFFLFFFPFQHHVRIYSQLVIGPMRAVRIRLILEELRSQLRTFIFDRQFLRSGRDFEDVQDEDEHSINLSV